MPCCTMYAVPGQKRQQALRNSLPWKAFRTIFLPLFVACFSAARSALVTVFAPVIPRPSKYSKYSKYWKGPWVAGYLLYLLWHVLQIQQIPEQIQQIQQIPEQILWVRPLVQPIHGWAPFGATHTQRTANPTQQQATAAHKRRGSTSDGGSQATGSMRLQRPGSMHGTAVHAAGLARAKHKAFWPACARTRARLRRPRSAAAQRGMGLERCRSRRTRAMPIPPWTARRTRA